ncbi:MAG: hypothetical protein AMJ81_11300 [Phycisphaerae bacterium SM23_33]|nr:MAG: hypothetical protein AMJ81_11300 [Phycisphaerae bacterium SM23_33]
MPVRSISELQGELQAKERQLRRLQSRRGRLAKQLDAMDRRIGMLVGGGPRRRRRRKKVRGVRKARRAVRRRKRAVARPKAARKRATGKPLAAYIRESLAKSANGLSVTQITQAVTSAGYRSHSKDFYGIVAKTLLTNKGFRRVKRGVYKLAG